MARRESLIQSIAGKQHGIAGAEVCQLCGQIGQFHGWVAAMRTHQGAYFTCFDCLHQVGGRDAALARLASQPNRFCAICQRSSDQPASDTTTGRLGEQTPVCQECRSSAAEDPHLESVEALVAELSRRRELESRTTESLETLDLNTEIRAIADRERAAAQAGQAERLRREAAEILRARHLRFPSL